MPVKAAAPVVEPWSWTGLYIGGDIGGAWGFSHFPDPFGPSIFGDTVVTPGFTVGGTAGYNYQINSLVLGLEGTLNFTNVDGTNTCFAFSGTFTSGNCEAHTDWLGSLAGRVGFADGHTLYYAKGGLAGAYNIFSATTAPGVNATTTRLPLGWTAGGGLEYAMTPRWSVKLEYDYYSFANGGIATPYGVSIGVPQELHQVMLGVNRKFGDYDPSWPTTPLWPAAMPLKAAPALPMPPPPEEWNFELGMRYWYSSGMAKDDLYHPSGALASRLTYDNLVSASPEIFGRLDMPAGVFLKGFLGAGSISTGKQNDEDWAPPVYSNAIAQQKSGNIDYATIDIGHDLISGSRYRIGAFIGYNYFDETIPVYGCVQLANPSYSCAPTSPWDNVITERTWWQSIRIGVNAQFMAFDRVKVEVDAAYIPYVWFDERDNHWQRAPTGAGGLIFPSWGNGNGMQLEAIVSYLLTDQFSVGIGGRYWSMGTPRQTTDFSQYTPAPAQIGPDSGYRFDLERYGIFAQGSYRFAADGTAYALGSDLAATGYAASARNWTGFYTGLSVGARANAATATATCLEIPCSAGAPYLDPVPGVFDSASPRLGLYFGYNWHALPNYVVGIEGDVAWANSKSIVDDFWYTSAVNLPADPATMTEGGDGSARARVGYLINPRLMIYATGGVAGQQEQLNITCFGGTTSWCTEGSKSETKNAVRLGWTAGGGVEWAVWRNWVSRIEYRFADYGSINHTFYVSTPADTIAATEKLKTHTALVGIAYQFGSYEADLPVPVPVYMAAPADANAYVPRAVAAPAGWTGAYLGVSLGGRWADTEWTTTGLHDPPVLPPDPTHNPISFNSATLRAGGYFGYNWQFAAHWLVGTEADAAWGNSSRTFAGIPGTFGTGGEGAGPGAAATDQSSVTEGWDASYRARLGFLVTPAWLIYATAGAAWQDLEINARCWGTLKNASWCDQFRNETDIWAKPGWTVGGGVEANLRGNWFGRVEYRFADYGSVNNILLGHGGISKSGLPGANVEMTEQLSTHTVLLGFAYRFSGPLFANN